LYQLTFNQIKKNYPPSLPGWQNPPVLSDAVWNFNNDPDIVKDGKRMNGPLKNDKIN
jgi:hypothetical protein